eukprot:960396_1
MAGAGQPFYMPLFFPIGNLAEMVTQKKDVKPPKPVATPQLDLSGHLTSICAATRSWFLAYLCIYVLYSDYNYPGFGSGKTLEWSWMKPIIIRDILATIIIAGFWDYILYFSPFKQKLNKFKFNKVYPSNYQIAHDIFWTLTASLCGAGIEIFLCYMWSNGYFKYRAKSLMDDPIYNFFWIITITHWRIPHFHLIHRMMHPWKFKYGPDVGKFLYKWVHSLHHKSYNPTAFSGTNMHPVESTLYYSAALVCIPIGCHPTIAVGCIIDCAVGAWLGHDGFQWPGSGDFFHQIHHQHFDCNYGAMHVPLDQWFGTYVGCKEDLKKVWGKKDTGVGREANEKFVPVHPDGE